MRRGKKGGFCRVVARLIRALTTLATLTLLYIALYHAPIYPFYGDCLGISNFPYS